MVKHLLKRYSFIFSIAIAVLVLFAVSPAQANMDLPDPTRPGSYNEKTERSEMSLDKQFKLHSVLISSTRRVAIINEKSVEVGDQVSGAVVRRIDKNHVELDKQGARFSLNLMRNDFKQRK